MVRRAAMEVPLESRLAAELEPGERLLWSSRPKQGLVLRGVDALLIPFSLLWGGFAIFWETMVVRESWRSQAAHHNVPIFFVLWGVPFVLIGLYIMFGRFITDARMRARTIYGITDRRVLILSGLFGTTVRGFNLRSLTDISVSERRDGIGTLKFGDDGSPWSRGNPWPGMRSYARPILELIEQPRRVYEIIRGAQQKLG